jgi:RimJ/RimL family protein N-acetyltransferase
MSERAQTGVWPSSSGDVLLTPRLRLRRWRPEDEPPMRAINRHPEVARHLNRPPSDGPVDDFHLFALAHWEQHGFGPFALESREPGLEGAFLGFTGVAHPVYLPALATRVELGWRLGRTAWGRGLATEAALAVREHALTTLALRDLISVVHPENVRSQRVTTKLGMEIERQVHNPLIGLDVDVWALASGR